MERRQFLKHFSMLAAASAAATSFADGTDVKASGVLKAHLFTFDPQNESGSVFPQSVASGDPSPRSIVLWTRISPDAITDASAPIGYEIAADEAFRKIVLRGNGVVNPAELNHTVKVKVASSILTPHATYYYRFIYAQTVSRTGRFRTLPEAEAEISCVKFSFLSCQDYTNGYYTAYDYLVDEKLDFIVWLGDYIYEAVGDPSYQQGLVRTIDLPSGNVYAQDLYDYYHLYNTYRSDEKLQRVHEQFAFITIWDDHEFANDCYDGDHAPDHNYAEEGDGKLLQLRLDANLAWFANQPVDVWYDEESDSPFNISIYRAFRFGNLMELVMTDERLYRSAHPCGEGSFGERYAAPGCDAITDPARTMLGAEQKQWFLDTIGNSNRRWVVWGNEVTMMQMRITGIGDYLESYINLDQWDGFQAERQEILDTVQAYKVIGSLRNFVAVTGDIHSYIAGHLLKNFDNPLSEVIAPEFVGTSVTSSNLYEMAIGQASGVSADAGLSGLLQTIVEQQGAGGIEAVLRLPNPHIKYFNTHQHGYPVVAVTAEHMVVRYKVVNTIRENQADLETIKCYEILDNDPTMYEIECPDEIECPAGPEPKLPSKVNTSLLMYLLN